jgi:apolipoprotein D and lipocalin family protein
MKRKGLTIGSGRKGYYNIQGRDPLVHKMSAKGIKQIQKSVGIPKSQFKQLIKRLDEKPFPICPFCGERHFRTRDRRIHGCSETLEENQKKYTEYMTESFRKEIAEIKAKLSELKQGAYTTETILKLLPLEAELKRLEEGVAYYEKSGIERVAEQKRLLGGKLNLNRYLGKWYEISKFPNWFQSGCKNAIAEYSKKKGYIEVKNSCLKNGKRDFRYAKAYKVGDNSLEVDFVGGRIFTGDYNVLYVDKDYKNAVVGSGDKYLWVLSRTPKVSDAQYRKLVSIAKQKGFDTTKLKK